MFTKGIFHKNKKRPCSKWVYLIIRVKNINIKSENGNEKFENYIVMHGYHRTFYNK